MGKILVITVPVEGHFNPFLPLLIKLNQKGHEVLCLAGRKFQKKVDNSGTRSMLFNRIYWLATLFWLWAPGWISRQDQKIDRITSGR